MEFRKRLLVVLMAVSLMVVFDVFANGGLVVSRVAESMVRTSPGPSGSLIEEGAPFLAKQGTLSASADGISRVVVRGVEEIFVMSSGAPAVTVDYGVRTYAKSSRHAQEYHQQANVRLVRAGETLEVVFDAPEGGPDLLGFRTSYQMTVPEGVALELEDVTGSASLHGLAGTVVFRRPVGAVTITEHVGDVQVEESTGHTWLAGVQGDVRLSHRQGHVELIAIDGEVAVESERTSVLAETVRGGMTVSVERGIGIFYSVEGDLTAQASMAHIIANGIGGALELEASMSPVELGASVGPVRIASEGANVRLAVGESDSRSLDIRVEKGEIVTDLPLEIEREGRGVHRLAGALGAPGGDELRVQARRGDVVIGSLLTD